MIIGHKSWNNYTASALSHNPSRLSTSMNRSYEDKMLDGFPSKQKQAVPHIQEPDVELPEPRRTWTPSPQSCGTTSATHSCSSAS
jgi:hypothetical protein